MHFSSGTAFVDGRLLAAAGDDVEAVLEAAAKVDDVLEAAAAAAADVAIVSEDDDAFTADDVLLCTVVVDEDTDVLDVIDVFLTATSVLFVLIVRSISLLLSFTSIFTLELPNHETMAQVRPGFGLVLTKTLQILSHIYIYTLPSFM